MWFTLSDSYIVFTLLWQYLCVAGGVLDGKQGRREVGGVGGVQQDAVPLLPHCALRHIDTLDRLEAEQEEK